ncbi:MAG: hypothetical protein NZ959_02965 [Armatimonadetes bacterium]|nr:hypothetical protein [Armatimonadota bacterium]MDW8121588.1 hypothetical protein [Armatimonadota bacterium]
MSVLPKEDGGVKELQAEEDSGVTIHNVPSKSRWILRFRLKPGSGKFYLDAMAFEDLFESGAVAPTEELRELMADEIFRHWDTEILMGEPSFRGVLEPPVVSEALSEVLVNVAGRLGAEQEG